MNNNDNSIASFIFRKLFWLNKEHAGIANLAANDDYGIQRVRKAMESANNNLDKISFEGIELSKEDMAQIKLQVPAAFKKKPLLYQTADGSLKLEVIE